MEKEERVIVDYDKYQELLAKANLNEKYIEDIKSKLSKEYENKIRDFENKSHKSFEEGLHAGISLSHSEAARTIRKELLDNLDSILENVPALSFWSYITSLFCSKLREGIDETIKNSIRNMCR